MKGGEAVKFKLKFDLDKISDDLKSISQNILTAGLIGCLFGQENADYVVLVGLYCMITIWIAKAIDYSE